MRVRNEPQLLFLLFDQMQRHAACSAAHASVAPLMESLQGFQELVSAPEFESALLDALNEPDSTDAKRIIREVEKSCTLHLAKYHIQERNGKQ